MDQRIVTLHDGFQFQILPGWKGVESLTRVRQRSLHMHCFIGDLLAASWPKPSPENITVALSLIDDWCATFEYPRDAHTMAFHDETTARRMGYWLRLYLALRGVNDLAAADHLWQKIDALFSILNQDDFYAGRNNHGMFQDMALLYFCRCSPDAPDIQHKALGRLLEYFEQSVSADGVHKEHSPAYHYLIAENITRHLPLVGSLDRKSAEMLGGLVKRMGRYAVNIAAPDGKYPPIGDTEPEPIPANYLEVFGLDAAVPEQSAVFFDGGYAILRDDPTRLERQTYAVLCASHHGDYHKHQDDLSVLLYADGWILGESGPYGYDYAHPMSKHGYSAASHSTLFVDGLEPSMATGMVSIEESRETKHTATVAGSNRRYPGMVHRRSLALDREQSRVDIIDRVRADSRRGMALLWQLAPGVNAAVAGRTVYLSRNGTEIARISIESDALVDVSVSRGAQGPAGYVFPTMGRAEETTVLRVLPKIVSSWCCKTTISLLAA